MALDADVGWLWNVTEADGEYVGHHGEEARRAEAEAVMHLFDVVGDALVAAGLPRHREPRYPDPIAPLPERIRMGFYSSKKYVGLDSLLGHLRMHRRAPRRREELAEPAPPDAEHAGFEHLYNCGASPISVYVPLDFAHVIEVDPPPDVELRHVGSSFALARECALLMNLYDWFSETHGDYDWDLEQPPSTWKRVTEPHDFDEEIGLANRLLRAARLSIRMSASITFS